MKIFRDDVTVATLNKYGPNTMAETIGIEFTEVGEDFLKAKMPVDHRTHQPMGLLHGGASVALAETMGSVAAMCCVDISKQYCVGLDINANHLRSVKSGFVTGITKPIHIGKKNTRVGNTYIIGAGDLVCISRITMAVLDRKE